MGAIAGFLGMDVPEAGISAVIHTMQRRNPKGTEKVPVRGGGLLREADIGKNPGLREADCPEIAFSGRIHNREEITAQLLALGCQIPKGDDRCLLQQAWKQWGRHCPDHLNGEFAMAVWEPERNRLTLVRDRMGVQSLFYRECAGTLIFASEIKTILAFPGVRAQLDRQGAMELVLLGPGRIPDSGVLRSIRAIPPGCQGVYENGHFRVTQYWKLRDREHKEALAETAEHVKALVTDSVRLQTEPGAGAFLSGGLDSSILTALCAESSRGEAFHTFSVDYENNDRYFVPGKFQPNADGIYIQEMVSALGTRHHRIQLSPEDLLRELEDATAARDLPGMGDVDFSLMAFCREVRKTVPCVLSGECADEIFGGYPWFRDPEVRDREGFPWAGNIQQRASLLAFTPEKPRDFVMDHYLDTCRNTDILPGRSPQERRRREMVNLNLYWFMQTLLERNDRMRGDLEVRIPFCDYRIAEYMYTVPWEMKDFGGREKGLLRLAFRGILPESVRMRKKSPYPKTCDPRYEALAGEQLKKLYRQDAPLWQLINREATGSLLQSEFSVPWYGQLMRRPQLIAWLLQTDFWLSAYQIDLML